MLAAIAARGDTAGADAQAYWAAVRIWLEGGDPYHPTGPFLPYVYAPWMLPLFAPWALLPWDVAWFAWRGGTIVAAAVVDPLGVRAAAPADRHRRRPALVPDPGEPRHRATSTCCWPWRCSAPSSPSGRSGGLIWGLATWMKWIPVLLWPTLPPRARSWGLVVLALSGLLSLLMLPLTILQLQVLFGFGARPIRADFLVFIWSAVPWWWRRDDPFACLRPAWWVDTLRLERRRSGRFVAAFRADPRRTAAAARGDVLAWGGRFLGLRGRSRGDAGAEGLRADPTVADIGD